MKTITVPLQSKLGVRNAAGERVSSDRLVFLTFVFSLFSIFVQISLIVFNWSNLPPEVPIFYSRPWGELVLATPHFLWVLPIITIILVFTNYFIALFLIRSHFFLNRVLIVFSAIIAFATLYDLTRIIWLLV